MTYDALTRLASHICDAPIALVSLIDEDRQWFKSRIGLDVAETSRDLAFCAHAILEPDSVFEVADATLDERFADNPLVTEDPSIRFYAGAPIVTRAGNALGTLCVIDRVPRTLSDVQRRALTDLSIQVMSLLELRRTVAELESKHQQLEEVMRLRETFLATVSHELRTPLSAVVGYVEILADPTCEIDDDDRREILATVGRQAGDVASLVEDLLVAAKAESGELRVQNVPVDLVAQTAQVLEGLNNKNVNRIMVEHGVAVGIGDPVRVRQIVRNLVTNAFRYGGPNITLSTRTVADSAILEVADDGPGVRTEDEDLIFEPFRQSAGTVSGSVGLGLSVSRLLAERMNGSLTYVRHSDLSVFKLAIPAA
ncbi:MAG: GAF domain-containing sensor histidine kinase [Acidimicrobiia bacterium]|nr:GAF domain-containing sensor histidine kinase [Acidimicrobiia bacterium]